MGNQLRLTEIIADLLSGAAWLQVCRPLTDSEHITLEDLRQIGELLGRHKAPYSPEIPRWSSATSKQLALVSSWLAGLLPDEAYHPQVARKHDGTVASVTTAELVASITVPTDAEDYKNKKVAMGEILTILGWRRRYITNRRQARRERRYFPRR